MSKMGRYVLDLQIQNENYIMAVEKMIKIAVIDQSVSTLTICKIPKDLQHEDVEWLLESKGFKMTNCSWGEFQGDIIHDDNEEEHVGPPEMYLGDNS